MKKEKILKFILLLVISFAIIVLYDLMQYLVGIFVFGFREDTPPTVSQLFFDTVCCAFQIGAFAILYLIAKKIYFDRGEDEQIQNGRWSIGDIPKFLPKMIVISLGFSGLVNLWLVVAEKFLTFIPAIKDSISSFSNAWSGVGSENYLFVLGSIVVLGPIVEEFMFRGFVYNAAKKVFGDYFAVFFSAILFGVWHREPVQVVYVIFVGLVLGIVYMRTRNIIFPMIMHILNNFYSALPPGFNSQEWNNRVTIVCYIMLLPAIYMVYRLIKQDGENKIIKNNEKYIAS